MKLSLLIIAVTAAIISTEVVDAAPSSMSNCVTQFSETIINLLQNGQESTNFAQCTKDNSGNGYAAGVINFTTGSGDAWRVIKTFMSMKGYANEFDEYKDNIDTYIQGNDGSTEGLDNFCDGWKKASDNKSNSFWNAQETILGTEYYKPAQKQTSNLKIALDVTKAAVLDSAIVDGPGSGKTSMGGIIKTTNNMINKDIKGDSGSTLSINGYNVDEIAWLKLFLKRRTTVNSGSKPNVNAYNQIIKDREYSWDTSTLVVQDDSGEEHTLQCH
ncbi:hypothetical protein GGI25_004700 [Coemansia spiralis]|uniref:Uncharacterized protein n=2 Tax=Coemansia TaxID=4863 RepID=A0A9W8KVC1_9FUNG|nr:hypothetical protein EDC05_004471 [Coemansia umbellata]KAJ2621377.1 hypothetical protein GGI26_004159 [Coemansia sp. RSA 1358]KAJ2673438.1 hypothetical protein GGI25_004700 [Coemansia spiralis]